MVAEITIDVYGLAFAEQLVAFTFPRGVISGINLAIHPHQIRCLSDSAMPCGNQVAGVLTRQFPGQVVLCRQVPGATLN